MIRNRVVYGIFLVLTVTFSYFYPGTISSLFFYTALIIPAASLIYTLFIYQKFCYLQEMDKKFVTKGEKVHFNVDVVNESKILYPFVEILFYGIDTIFIKHFQTKKIAILPNSKGRYDFELECQYRGYYEVGLKQIRIKDFLGFFSFKYNVFEPRYITVYPKIVVLDTFPISMNKASYTEGTLSGKEEDQMTLSDIRKYAYGDSIKKIHWKLSAKKDELVVKNFDGAVAAKADIFLDLTQNHFSILENTVLEDQVIETAVAVVHYCLAHNIEAELIYHNEKVIRETASDYSHFDGIYNTLFKLRFDSQIDFAEAVKLALAGSTERNTAVFITSNIEDNIYSQISILHELGHDIILIYISAAEFEKLDETQKMQRNVIFEALQEIGIKTFKVHINDDIKDVLEC